MPNVNNGLLDGVRRIGAKFRDLTVDGGLPGAPLGLRLRGATTAGAPVAGTWKAGDEISDRNGGRWTCTAGGTPGTWIGTPGLLASTGASGYTMVNGTGAIITWTAPNDGAMHGVTVAGVLVISSTETGGELAAEGTDPSGAAFTRQVMAASQAASSQPIGLNQAVPSLWLIKANTTFTLQQFTALTGGASVLYAELWGS
jgi:hypothetical protein